MSKNQFISLIAILKDTLPIFGSDLNDVHINMAKFISGSILSFECIEQKVLSDKYTELQDFICDLRLPFLRVLGWYYRVEYTGLRIRARECLDMITYYLDNKSPFPGLALCREALDKIYTHVSVLADRFAFNPNKYAENRLNGGWPGASDLDLFTIQFRLEMYMYEGLGDFANDLERLGATYATNSKEEILAKGGISNNERFTASKINEDGSVDAVLYDYAVFIKNVAVELTKPPSERSYVSCLNQNGMLPKTAMSYPICDDEQTVLGRPSGKCGYSDEWRFSYFDTSSSPVWKLMWIDDDSSSAYMTFARMLLMGFEIWAKDVPLCAKLEECVKGSATEGEWLASATCAHKDKKCTTLAQWRKYQSRASVVNVVAESLLYKLDEGADIKASERKSYEELLQNMSKMRVQKMGYEENAALEFAWNAYLRFRTMESIAKQQQANIDYVKRVRMTAQDVAQQPAKGGKSALSLATQRAVEYHLDDVRCLHNMDFLKYWSAFPTLSSAMAISNFNEFVADEGEDSSTIVSISELFDGQNDDYESPVFRLDLSHKDKAELLSSHAYDHLKTVIGDYINHVDNNEKIDAILKGIFGDASDDSRETRFMMLNQLRVSVPGTVVLKSGNNERKDVMLEVTASDILTAREAWKELVDWFVNDAHQEELNASPIVKPHLKAVNAVLKAKRDTQYARGESIARHELDVITALNIPPIDHLLKRANEREQLRITATSIIIHFRSLNVESEKESLMLTNYEMDAISTYIQTHGL